MGCAVHLCGLLHQRYADFSHHLLEQLQKSYSGGIGKEEDKVGGGSCVGRGMVGGRMWRKNELFILTLYSQSAVTAKYRIGLRLLGEVR